MISKDAFESLPHNCGTPNCNYKRLKNREYFRARALGLDPNKTLFLPTKSRAKRTGVSRAPMAIELKEAEAANAATA